MNHLLRRAARGVAVFAVFAFIVLTASSQPPQGKEKKGIGEKKGPPPYEIGSVLPPYVRNSIELTPEQQKQIEELEKDVAKRLRTILTADQQKQLESIRPKGSPEAKKDIPEDKQKKGPNLNLREPLRVVGDKDSPFTLTGDAIQGTLGDPRKEVSGSGVRLLSGEDLNKDGKKSGGLSCTIGGLKPELGRWYRVQIRALAQDDFAVEQEDLSLKVEFFKENGKNSLDHIKKSIYAQVERERKNFKDAGSNRNLGLATWRNYAIEFHTPFLEVDTLRVSVEFGHGSGTATRSEFWISDVEVVPIPDPADYITPSKPVADKNPPALKTLVKLGGRWYYDPRGGGKDPPKQFDHTNADRLYYLTDRLETPFAGNLSAWRRKGYLDRDGKTVENDQFIADAVTITFTDKHLVMKSKNLPNHPTAVFPDRSQFLDGNPNIIQEQAFTWYIPLEPKENPNHIAMDKDNKNRALTIGSIGVAVNGVVFNNPYDIDYVEALWRLDRCCGHPSPLQIYHYHKYPVCVNTPWVDDGTGHSPLIGFAFDGFPVYGPYEEAGILAKDSKNNPLNEFNLHTDEARGPHYHVTPGKFPHIIGGFWGEYDPLNRGAKKGPPKKK